MSHHESNGSSNGQSTEPAPLRAEIRLTTNVAAGFERTLTLARTEDVSAAVQEWIASILRAEEQAG